MKMKNIIITGIILSLILGISSCVKDLDAYPIDEDEITASEVYKDAGSYKQVLAKIYAGLSLTGQQGPAGNMDIAAEDEGFTGYFRMLWMFEEITTDEAVNGWNDEGVNGLNYQTWTASNSWVTYFYARLYYQIALINEFIREASDDKLDERGISGSDKEQVQLFKHEARLLRALSYYHALDFYANVPFVTEDDKVGAYLPEQISRADLFDYIETELLDLENLLAEPMTNDYGRVDKAVAWTLLAKLYLNAEVFANTDRYTDCITYCKNVINAGYILHPDYEELFLADNYKCSGVIFPLVCDGSVSQSYANTTFLIHAATGGTIEDNMLNILGISESAWAGNRVTKNLVNLFDNPSDQRAMFWTDGQNLEINAIDLFTDGYACTKFKNLNSDGTTGSDGYYTDTDFPLMRLADVYLMYAEAVLRGGSGGDLGTATNYINELRFRAYGDNTGDISSISLDFILDERARELYWEAHRRTDLVRFGKFTGDSYLWPFKGGIAEGVPTHSRYNILPIPSADITANPKLEQNLDY